MIHRVPKKEPPKLLNSDIVRKSTNNIGVVDLAKIKEYMKEQAQQRREAAKRAVDTKNKKKDLMDNFIKIYFDMTNTVFKPGKKRFVSYKKSDNILIRKMYESDHTRLWKAYAYVSAKYHIGMQSFMMYCSWALKKALEEFDTKRETSTFGVVVSEKVMDQYYFERSKSQMRKATLLENKKRSIRDARYFQDDE